MRRREFITLLSGAAAAWPLAVHAQQPAMPAIGFLDGGSQATTLSIVAAYKQGLADIGYFEGKEFNNRIPLGECSI